MELWYYWLDCVWQLKGAFSRRRTFYWFVLTLMSMSIRMDLFGVTSFIRSLWLTGNCYHGLRRFFHSDALKLDQLIGQWVQMAVESLFAHFMYRVHSRPVLVVDGLKAPKEGRKMPGVKSLHQESESNSKPEFIMGHSCQAVSLLVQGVSTFFALPLSCRIHEGLVFSNRDKKSLLDKLMNLITSLPIRERFYVLADTYYASQKMATPLLRQGHHLICQARSNVIAHEPVLGAQKKKRGRPKLYGPKRKIREFFANPSLFTSEQVYLYGQWVTVHHRTIDLIWRPVGKLVRYVLVVYPNGNRSIFVSTDRSLEAKDIIELYGLRFKIEVSFRQAIHTLGAFSYRFWMQDMNPLSKGSGDQYLHRKDEHYRKQVMKKFKAYEAYIQIAMIAQGLLQYLSLQYSQKVWDSFQGWLRTMKKTNNPSELVVSKTLKHNVSEFLLDLAHGHPIKKFLKKRLDPSRSAEFLLSA